MLRFQINHMLQRCVVSVNRLSIGLQSANNRELEELGRIHTWEQFKETFTMAREVHFNNINIDVMAAIPEHFSPLYVLFPAP